MTELEVRRRLEVITLDEGDVTITFPEPLSFESVDILSEHFRLLARKLVRRALSRPVTEPEGAGDA